MCIRAAQEDDAFLAGEPITERSSGAPPAQATTRTVRPTETGPRATGSTPVSAHWRGCVGAGFAAWKAA